MKIGAFEQLVADAAGDHPGGIPILIAYFLDEIETAVNGGGARLRETFRDLHGALVAISGDFVNQAELAGLLCIEHPASEGQFDGPTLADGSVHGAENQKRPQAELDFGEPELGLLRCDGDVAIGHEAGSTADGKSVDGGDQRRAQAHVEREELLMHVVDGFGGDGAEFLEIHAGGERVAIAGQDDGANVRVAIGAVDGVDQFAAKVGAEGVVLIGTVERDALDAVLLGDFENFAHEERSMEGQRNSVRERAELAPEDIIRHELGVGGLSSRVGDETWFGCEDRLSYVSGDVFAVAGGLFALCAANFGDLRTSGPSFLASARRRRWATRRTISGSGKTKPGGSVSRGNSFGS